MVFNHSTPVEIKTRSGEITDVVDNFKYLGSWMKSTTHDFSVKKGPCVDCLSQTCEDLIKKNQKIKIRLFVATVESVLLYGSETWIFDKSMQKQQDGYYTRIRRMALNVSWKQHLTNEQLYRDLPLVSSKVRQRRLQLSGHCIKKRLHNTSYYGSQNFKQLTKKKKDYI